MTIAVQSRPLTKNSEGSAAGRRRVFVQIATGCVLDIELDRGDDAKTLKSKVESAPKVPTEESSLTIGDLVLKNALTRTFMQKSSSTPCLLPTGKKLIEILHPRHLSIIKELVNSVEKAIQNGVDPIPIDKGAGGSYYFRNCKGERIAIVKPTDEEPFAPNNPKGYIGKALGLPGLKKSIRVGETGFREVAAYLLDYNHFANVPPTALVKITHSVFNVTCNSSKPQNSKPKPICKIASFQQFIPHDFDACDHGSSIFPVAAVHRIGIFDVRIFNTDRHSGNLLVRKLEDGSAKFGGEVELTPIDHGLCLPETLGDPYFEWMHWRQASIPFSDEELEYIANLDSVRDSDMLRLELPMIREACIRVLVLCTTFLKEAAAFGLCLSDIGAMMSRRREDEPSELEVLCIEIKKLLFEEQEEDKHYGETGEANGKRVCASKERTTVASLQDSMLSISLKTEEANGKRVCASKLSISLKKVKANGKRVCASKERTTVASLQALCASMSSIPQKGINPADKNNANEQLPASASFVSLADMGEDEWGAFLEKFQELLQGAFCNRRYKSAGSRKM